MKTTYTTFWLDWCNAIALLKIHPPQFYILYRKWNWFALQLLQAWEKATEKNIKITSAHNDPKNSCRHAFGKRQNAYHVANISTTYVQCTSALRSFWNTDATKRSWILLLLHEPFVHVCNLHNTLQNFKLCPQITENIFFFSWHV